MCEQDLASWARRARSAESGLCPRKSRRRRRDAARAKAPSPRSAKKNTRTLPLLRTPAECVAPPTPPRTSCPSRNPARRRRRRRPRRLSRSASGARRTREVPARAKRSRTTLSRTKTKDEKGNVRLFAPRRNLRNRSRDRRTASRASSGAARRGRARRARPSSSRAPRRSRRTEAPTRKTRQPRRAGASEFLRKSFLASSWRTSSASTTPSRSSGTARATAPGAGWRIL
mmetsp:Transcript_13764/g.57856  ORF Transcript_13764/g.57856 Transcript_13764/m.57856 type:complete len:229 (-) Transcript_13764:816-1502(-)